MAQLIHHARRRTHDMRSFLAEGLRGPETPARFFMRKAVGLTAVWVVSNVLGLRHVLSD